MITYTYPQEPSIVPGEIATLFKDFEKILLHNIRECDIDLLAYRLGIINKEEWLDFDFYKYSPYCRIPKKIINGIMDKLRLVINDNLKELIDEKEQLIEELKNAK